VRQLLNRYFGLIVLAAMAAAGAAGGILRHSVVSAVLWALAVPAAVILIFILLGPIMALAEARSALRSEAARMGWVAALARAWAIGLIAWAPPNPVRTQFLAIWALVIGVVVLWILPRFPVWPAGARALAVAGFVILAGVINGAFHASTR
jgi:hypothetical protein